MGDTEISHTSTSLPVGLQVNSRVGSPAQLLVVEDHGYTAVLVCIILKMAGYEVQSVASVAEARQFLQEERIDLVLTDWMLTDGNGGDVCSAARAINPRMPIIVFSALDTKQHPQITQSQADAYLVKPVGVETLRPTVERLLARQ